VTVNNAIGYNNNIIQAEIYMIIYFKEFIANSIFGSDSIIQDKYIDTADSV
jgi:hypothetical protein